MPASGLWSAAGPIRLGVAVSWGRRTAVNVEMGGIANRSSGCLKHRTNRLDIATTSPKHAPFVGSFKCQPQPNLTLALRDLTVNAKRVRVLQEWLHQKFEQFRVVRSRRVC